MSADTLQRPDSDTRADDGSGTDEGDKFHYVRKNQIIKSVIDGDHVVALCGEVFPVTRQAKPGSPICPECQRVFDRLKK